MGLRGPAPKPDSIKRLEGNPGKRKLKGGETEMKTMDKVPEPPKHLMKEAKKAWKRLAPMLAANGLLTEMTADHFGETCQWWAKYQKANCQMMKDNEDGVCQMQVSESGYESIKPIVSLCGQYYDRWEKGIKEYGMTPASWARYMSITGEKMGRDEEDDPMASLID